MCAKYLCIFNSIIRHCFGTIYYVKHKIHVPQKRKISGLRTRPKKKFLQTLSPIFGFYSYMYQDCVLHWCIALLFLLIYCINVLKRKFLSLSLDLSLYPFKISNLFYRHYHTNPVKTRVVVSRWSSEQLGEGLLYLISVHSWTLNLIEQSTPNMASTGLYQSEETKAWNIKPQEALWRK